LPAQPTNSTQREIARAKDALAASAEDLSAAVEAYNADPRSTTATGLILRALKAALTTQSATLMAINEVAYRLDGVQQATGIEVAGSN
jgi:hypothetical protein